jgi:hypothetical protein
LGGIFTCGILNLFACNSTTKGAMWKWRAWLDSARQIGLETTLTRFLIVVERGITGGENVRAEFFALEMLWLPLLEPAELRTNICYGWIKEVGKVQK